MNTKICLQRIWTSNGQTQVLADRSWGVWVPFSGFAFFLDSGSTAAPGARGMKRQQQETGTKEQRGMSPGDVLALGLPGHIHHEAWPPQNLLPHPKICRCKPAG